MNGKLILRYGFVALVILLLAGCIPVDTEQTITFYSDEKWEAHIVIEMSRADLVNSGLSQDDVEAQIQETIGTLNPETVEITWEATDLETGELVYTLEAKGKGFNQLERLIQGSNETSIRLSTASGKTEIVFSAFFPLLPSGTNVLILKGGQIVTSNGEEVENGMVRWVNPQGQITAVIKPKGGFNFGTVLIALAVIGVVGGGIYLYKQRSTNTTAG
jgi:hypothetical protein